MHQSPHARRIVLSTLGSLGDVNPYVGIALELKARGHRPIIATTSVYREKIARLGIGFHGVRPDLPSYDRPEELRKLVEKCVARRTGAAAILKLLILPHLQDIYQDLNDAACGADLLVTHPLPLVGPIVAQKTGIPWVSSVLAPMPLFSAYDPPIGPQLVALQKLVVRNPTLSRLFILLFKCFTAPMMWPIHRLRREIGLPRGQHPLVEGQHSSHIVLALFSRVMMEPQPDWPPQTIVTGFPFYDERGRPGDTSELPPDLTRFLVAGPPPIVFTLGSSAVWIDKDFYRESIAAAQTLGERALLLVDDAAEAARGPMPSGMAAFDYVPHSRILPHAKAIVLSGGIGTTSQSLRAGKPLLIVPFAHDQFDNAGRVERLGIGLVISRERYMAKRAATALERLLGTPSFARMASDIGHQVQSENGIAVACDAIEQVLSRSSGPPC